ncbi:radical SAM protein [Salinispira pacifica]|uniref:Putative radical SAM family enzyme, NOT coproporphyrinogen III oxidase, oxygen-independent n=1 Tax=Salinispira pacifica TaxID=1307761 RepID=V5WEJ5_9SPIO|nr:radical SAM protein [Salinispira pacifica]AHC14035.1 putative radical SAM family enzyme, NOT coproporphyrinogen III oxidase, oxygen-independent [Salinispira pacifica]
MKMNGRFRSHHDTQAAVSKALENKQGKSGGPPNRTLPRESSSTEMKAAMANSLQFTDLLAMIPEDHPRGLYLHLPYCDRICSFCNMRREQSTGENLHAYARHLNTVFSSISHTPYVRSRPFDVLYFGGGTPSVLSNHDTSQLYPLIRKSLELAPGHEWTVESTLHNLTDEKLRIFSDCGVNRLSIGIQSFTDNGRKMLGRSGDGAWARRKFETIRGRFDGTVAIDLIYSWPGQSQEHLERDIQYIRELDIDSISFYSLMIHPGSTLSNDIDSGRLLFEKTDEYDRQMHNRFYESMLAQGYELLELTKIVKPGRDSYRYIDIRYQNCDLLPLGNGAGGRVMGHRVYHMDAERTMISPPKQEADRYNLLIGLLQFGNYHAEKIASILSGLSFEFIENILSEYESAGLLSRSDDDGARRLSPDGVFWGNNLAVDLIERVIEAQD